MHRLLVVVFLTACHGVASEAPDASADAPGSTWQPLVTRSWNLAPSQQAYQCRRIQAATDMWISGFRELSPLGTHHVVLSVSTATNTGDYDCDPNALVNEMQMLYGAGIHTDDLAFPPGVAVHVRAGQYLTLQLHLFNTGDESLAGESGVLVQQIAPESVAHEASMTFGGTIAIDLPPDSQPHTAQGGCTIDRDMHVVALFPHMHQLGIQQKLVLSSAGTVTTLFDAPFTFGEQRNVPIADTLFRAGDRVDVTCTYINTTSQRVHYGNSSTEEMCFTGIYAYPPLSSLYGCVSL